MIEKLSSTLKKHRLDRRRGGAGQHAPRQEDVRMQEDKAADGAFLNLRFSFINLI